MLSTLFCYVPCFFWMKFLLETQIHGLMEYQQFSDFGIVWRLKFMYAKQEWIFVCVSKIIEKG